MAIARTEKRAVGYPWMSREIHDAFTDAGDNGICIADLHRRLRERGSRASYQTVYRFFYCLRQMGLIELAGTEPARMEQSFDKRLYRVVKGKEDADEWKTYPIIALYPSAGLGGARYMPGTSTGRAKEYAKD